MWRDSVLRAYAEDDAFALARAANSAMRVDLSANALLKSGAGHLSGDAAVWARASPATAETMSTVRLKWKAAFASSEKVLAKQKPVSPFLVAPAEFHVSVTCLLNAATLRLASSFSVKILRETCIWLSLAGFSTLQSLELASENDIVLPPAKASVRSCIASLIRHANEEAEVARVEKRRRIAWDEFIPTASASSASAEDLIERIAPLAIEDAERTLDSALNTVGLSIVPDAKPAMEMAAWAAAKRSGANVELLLKERGQLLSLESARNNGKARISGLRAWHYCCVEVLGIPPEKTLPPQSVDHLRAFVGMFRNGATAANYINHVLSGCKLAGLPTDWHTRDVMQLKSDARARSQRLHITGQREVAVLSELLLCRLVSNCVSVGMARRGLAYLIWWNCLLRVQSEGCAIYVGEESWAHSLPSEVFTAAWVVQEVLFVRIRRRKHRPHGSLLRSPCTCNKGRRLPCVVHAFLTLRLAVGELIVAEAPHSALATLRRQLSELAVADPKAYAFKVFRCGCATAMVARGDSLATILAAGEWKSSAFLSYVNESEVDRVRFVSSLLESEEADEA